MIKSIFFLRPTIILDCQLDGVFFLYKVLIFQHRLWKETHAGTSLSSCDLSCGLFLGTVGISVPGGFYFSFKVTCGSASVKVKERMGTCFELKLNLDVKLS